MQTCFCTQLSYFMDNAASPDIQSPNEDLLDFATGECQSSVPHEVSEQTDLSLELLHATLRRKQEEISALKVANAQLRNLAKQTEHYTTLLDHSNKNADLTNQKPGLQASFQRDLVSHCTSVSPTEDHSSEHCWISLLTQEEPSDPSSTALTNSTTADTQSPTSGVKRQLWSSWNELLCEDAEDCPSGSKWLRLDNELVQVDLEHLKAQLDQDEQTPQQLIEDSTLTQNQSLEMSSEGLIAQRKNIFGAFHGLLVVTETPSIKSDLNMNSDDGKVVCFKTAIRDHSTVKTKVFPHGKAFTSHTPSGSCRFLWVPNEH
ncbi:multicilin isoform X2 [Megalobrama amblycephala]|uniref:multicilin isoform X2 n=1 Tax=Megalobrama amblycephala TaxID=75352 RepID=UPI0020146209|nr:multicilin isoform X2 [Megalobrama amblycephala]